MTIKLKKQYLHLKKKSYNEPENSTGTGCKFGNLYRKRLSLYHKDATRSILQARPTILLQRLLSLQ